MSSQECVRFAADQQNRGVRLRALASGLSSARDRVLIEQYAAEFEQAAADLRRRAAEISDQA